jgi:hypothetical protein
MLLFLVLGEEMFSTKHGDNSFTFIKIIVLNMFLSFLFKFFRKKTILKKTKQKIYVVLKTIFFMFSKYWLYKVQNNVLYYFLPQTSKLVRPVLLLDRLKWNQQPTLPSLIVYMCMWVKCIQKSQMIDLWSYYFIILSIYFIYIKGEEHVCCMYALKKNRGIMCLFIFKFTLFYFEKYFVLYIEQIIIDKSIIKY